MSSAGSVRFTGLFPDRAKHTIVYSFKSNIKKEAEAPLWYNIFVWVSKG
jgi:hypothetical protein